jgi:pimeloyl-ACP methyl ester carboxylesterase
MPLELIRERVFENNGTKLAAKEWGRPGFPPVIALHGWLDNANSFDRMLPFLDDIHLIAIDKAGHGLSGSRSADSGYDIWQDIGDVIAVADAMDFDRFGLLGHSRGASICALVAGCFPQRVSALMLVEGYLPMPDKPQDAPTQIARALHENRRFASASPTFFPSFERAVQARVDGFIPLKPEAARMLAERGVKERDGGFYWANDQRLKAASMVKFTSDQLKGFCDAIACPVKLIKAEDSVLSADHLEPEMLTWIPQMQVMSMPGSHHLHLEDQAQEVALEAQSFFA